MEAIFKGENILDFIKVFPDDNKCREFIAKEKWKNGYECKLVPIPNGSLVVLNLEVAEQTSIAEVNSIMKKYALEGELVEQIKYSLNNELVSSDIIGTSAPAIYYSSATIVSKDGKNIVLYIWYDNEYGYSHQVIRLAKYIAKERRFTYY